MAASRSAILNEHVERLLDVPVGDALAELVERLTSEGLIDMKSAAAIYGPRVHKSTPTRHVLNGVRTTAGRVVKLEAIRIGGALRTSRAAVLRFFSAQQAELTSPAPIETPAKHTSAAAIASKKVASLLGTKS